MIYAEAHVAVRFVLVMLLLLFSLIFLRRIRETHPDIATAARLIHLNQIAKRRYFMKMESHLFYLDPATLFV